MLFLTSWNALRPTDSDYTVFRVKKQETYTDGFIVPYGQTPLNTELVGQDVYMNILTSAKEYVYIFTPYLIIDTDMVNALILTAQKGVDVRIITPGIPDKKMVWQITRSYYRTLIRGGVKIYEYTPGFDHSKVFVSDDKTAAVGTLNLDYRSLYLHFENGTYLYGSKKIMDIKEDFMEACEKSQQIELSQTRTNLFKGLFINIIKLFSAQM